MLVALREFSLGDRGLEPGDEITFEEQKTLPAGRIEQLKHLRLVEEQTDEQAMDRRVRALEERIAKLEEAIVPADEKPKRKRKPPAKRKAAS